MNRRRFFALFASLVLPYGRAIAKPKSTAAAGIVLPALIRTGPLAIDWSDRKIGTVIWSTDRDHENNLRILREFYETNAAPWDGWRFRDWKGYR